MCARYVSNGELVADDHVKPRLFNEYFRSLFSSGGGVIPPASASIFEKMPLVEVSVRGIEHLLKNIDETKATEPDGVFPRILLLFDDEVVFYLNVLHDKSLRTGQLQEDWKVAHVVSIHKGGAKKTIGSYCPIS